MTLTDVHLAPTWELEIEFRRKLSSNDRHHELVDALVERSVGRADPTEQGCT